MMDSKELEENKLPITMHIKVRNKFHKILAATVLLLGHLNLGSAAPLCAPFGEYFDVNSQACQSISCYKYNIL